MTVNSATGGCVFYRSDPGFPIKTIPEPQCTWVKNFLRWKGLPITGDGLNELLAKPVMGIVVQAETPSTQWLPGKLEATFNPAAPILKNGVVVTIDGVPGSPDAAGVTKFTTGYAHWVTLKVTAPGYYPYERSDFYAQGAAYSWRTLFHYIALKPKSGTTPPNTTPPAGGTKTLTVTVLDKSSSSPVYGAKVVVGQQTNTTNGAGVAIFSVSPGTYTVTATKDTYAGTATVTVSSAQAVTVYLSPASSSSAQPTAGLLSTTWGKVLIFGGGAALIYLLMKKE